MRAKSRGHEKECEVRIGNESLGIRGTFQATLH